MASSEHYSYAIGRRKSSIAKVRLTNGKGQITVNGKPASEYFADAALLLHNLERPFRVIENNKFNASVLVSGGGHSAQVDAIVLGISKALLDKNPDFKATLRKAKLLGRDPRAKERKKFGLKGARKQRQFTKR